METILRKSFKNLFAIVLSTVVALSVMVTNAFALNSQTKSVKVTGLENGAEVRIYKIIDVVWDQTVGQPKEPVYKWNKDFVNFVDAKYKTESDGLVKEWKTLNTPVIKNVLEGLANETDFVKTVDGVVAKGTQTAVNGEVTFEGLGMGEYLVLAKSSTRIYSPTTVAIYPQYNNDTNSWELVANTHANQVQGSDVNPFTVAMKSEELLKPEKTTTSTDVKVGDTVEYVVSNIKIPTYPTNVTNIEFKVSDTMGKGLLFNKESLKVYTVKNGEETLVNASNYTLTTKVDNPALKTTFEVVFNETFIKENYGVELKLTYNATLTEDAFELNTTTNKVEVSHSNNAGSGSNFDEVSVHTYGFRLVKTDSKGNPITTDAAHFELYDKAGTKLTFVKKGNDYVLAADQANCESTLITDENGVIYVKGLKLGTYTLKEIKAPNGYVLLEKDVTITLTDTDKDGVLDVTPSDLEHNKVTVTENLGKIDNALEFNVANLKDGEIELPNTGGMGTVMFTVGGIVLMAGAAFFLIASNRKERE